MSFQTAISIIILVAACIIVLFLFNKPAGAETMVASYYGREHHGRRTASGARFDMNGFTAAHRRLPFGTRLHVCRRGCVTVRITDRGPWTRGRHLDLSAAAARAIGLPGVGAVSVTRM